MKALSIRQPWAWMIVHGGKDIENRSWATTFRGRVLVHASKGCTEREYEEAMDFVDLLYPDVAMKVPDWKDIERGGIVGEVEIVGCIHESQLSQISSPWFFGPYGFVLRNARPLPFRPYKGALGFFKVEGAL